MLPVLVAALVGFTIGLVRRPFGAHVREITLAVPGLGIAGAALQVAGAILGLPAPGLALALSLGLLTVFAVRNLHVVGMGVVAIGLAANLAVVTVNGAMPVRARALIDAGVVDLPGLGTVDLGFGRQFERTDDLIVFLGDIIPVSAVGAVMSFGDLVVLAGIGAVAGDLARFARRGQRWLLAPQDRSPGEPIRPSHPRRPG